MMGCNRRPSRSWLVVCFAIAASASSIGRAEEFHPAPQPKPLAQRDAPYSMTYYHLSGDAAFTRRMLTALSDAGITRSLTLLYWWQHETLGDDEYWRKEYRPEDIGDGYLRKLDLYVNTSLELGMKPSFRLGSYREFRGLWHPADKSGSVENYAAWVKRIAARYRGKVDHYIVGDEENQAHPDMGWDGSARTYMDRMFLPLAKAIREADPAARISACGMSSAPSTHWVLELIKLGLPRHGDGVAMNVWHEQFDEPTEIVASMRRIRQAWPDVRFYASGVGYAVNRGGANDRAQAAVVARAMFNAWDIGWDAAPYYLYAYSITADTKENYGIVGLTPAGELEPSDAFRAYATIAQTFYDRRKLQPPPFDIRLEQADRVALHGGGSITLAPPQPHLRAFVRDGTQLLLYLAYHDAPGAVRGMWDVVLDTGEWGQARETALFDHERQADLPVIARDGRMVIPGLVVTEQPRIVTLRKRR